MREEDDIVTIDLPHTPPLVLLVSRYVCGGRPAAVLVCAETDELWCDLTVNLPYYELPDDWTFVPEKAYDYVCALECAGLIDEVGGFVPYGNFGQRAVAVRFDERLLEAADRGTGTGMEAFA